MISMKDFFYPGEEDVEPVWIVKPEKKQEDGGKKGEKKPEVKPEPTAIETAFGPYLPYYHRPYNPPAPEKKPEPAQSKVVLKVPICCIECDESVTMALKALKGVKDVKCDIPDEKVTVEVDKTASADDVLLESRKLFKKSRLWSKED